MLIQVEGKGEAVDKRYKHFQTLDAEEYEDSSLKEFLNGELVKNFKAKSRTSCENRTSSDKDWSLCRRRRHELDSNPHYNLFNRIRFAETKENLKI